MSLIAQWKGICAECGYTFAHGTEIESRNGLWVHLECPDPTTQYDLTLDGKYNALVQKVDRIMTGDQRLRVSGGAVFMAQTEKHDSRVDIQFDHQEIAKWAEDGRDRTALTLALNLHELGHVFFTPGRDRVSHPRRVVYMLNALEDQRQEMLTALRFPKAVDYFRFLNARALMRASQEGKLDGRYFLLHYGRRHLYPQAVNDELRALALKRYVHEAQLRTIERLITEYQLLDLPAEMDRGWKIAEELAEFDRVDELIRKDLRHDCMPAHGQPTARPKERQLLRARLQKLLGTPEQGAAEQRAEAVSVAQEPKAAPGGEPGDLSQSSQADPGSSEGQGAGAGQPESKGAAEDETSSAGPAEDEKPGPEESAEPEGEPDAGAGTSGGDEPQQDGADESDLDEDDLDTGDEDGDGGDDDFAAAGEAGLGDTGDEPQAERAGRGGLHAGSSGTGNLPDPGDLASVLGEMMERAIDNVGSDLDAKHEALKSTDVPVDMGGKARGALESEFAGSARQLAGLFREVNQDLKPTMHRNLKRGRLDARRVSVAVANNSPRMFKRRQGDLSPDAAMAVSIMIDVSSSMWHRMHQAIGAGFALARGVELAGHIAKVTTYDTVHKVQKNWLDKQYSMKVQHGGGGTNPYPMLRLARGDFRQVALHEEIHNHVAIIVTDGAWSAPQPCQEAIDALVKDDVHVILIGVGMVPYGYEHVTVLTTPDVHGLAAAMTQPLRKLAVEIARGVRKKVAI